MALSPPLVHYAGLIFTEVPAALVLTLALRHGRAAVSARTALVCRRSRRSRACRGSTCGTRSWPRRSSRSRSPRVPIPKVAAAWTCSARRSRRWRSRCTTSILYGFFDPRRVYGRRPELSLSGLPAGLPGLLFDQEFGLLVYAPVFVLAVPGLVAPVAARRGASR